MKYKAGLSLSVMIFALAAIACRISLPAQTASNVLPTATSAPLASQTLTVVPVTMTATLPSSQTPTPTQTSFPTITPYPTITPIPTDSPIPSVTALGAGPTATPQFGCELIDKYPDQWATFKTHTAFQARWTLKNTGSKTWFPRQVEFRYISGVKMYATEEKQNLNNEVIQNSQILLIVNMISPKAKGAYATTWGLVDKRSNTVFCAFTAKITTK